MREILSPSLAERTSLHLGGRAIAELVLERAEDYPLLAERLQQLGGSPFIIGAGTNLLARMVNYQSCCFVLQSRKAPRSSGNLKRGPTCG